MKVKTSIPVVVLSSLGLACAAAERDDNETFGDELSDVSGAPTATSESGDGDEGPGEDTETSADDTTTVEPSDTDGDEDPCVLPCGNGDCDPELGVCICDVGYQGESCEEVFPDCKALLEAFPEAPDGFYMVDPSGEDPFEAYCDMTTDGGGWMVVFKNHGGAMGGELSNLVLLEGNPEGFTGAISPHTDVLKSGINDKAWTFYKDRGQLEWLKHGTLWDPNDLVVHEQSIRLVFGDTTWEWILEHPGGELCVVMPSPISVVLNGEAYLGQTDRLLMVGSMASYSYGLANQGPSLWDRCDDPDFPLPNMIETSDPRLFHHGSIRHLLSYRYDEAGTNASRCQFYCWNDTNVGFYDGFTWMVRPG